MTRRKKIMNYFNNLTTNIPRIFSYNKKNHLSLNIKKKNNKAEENKISLTQLHQSKNLSINDCNGSMTLTS